MAQTITPKAPDTVKCTVLRAICIAGERVEPGTTIELSRSQYNEAASAAKVGPLAPKPEKPAKSKPAPQEDTAP